MYKLISESLVRRMSDNCCIPFSDENTDYQAYVAWLAEGNTPEPAEEPMQVQVKTVSAAQGGIALIRAGLMKAVQDVANDPTTAAEVKWAFEKATEWSRDSAALNYLAQKAGITDSQLDALYEDALQIVA